MKCKGKEGEEPGSQMKLRVTESTLDGKSWLRISGKIRLNIASLV
jgi:hypothetical protein